MKPEKELSYRPGGRPLDVAVFGLALFTLLCHIAVGWQMGLDQLIALSAPALILALGIGVLWRRKIGWTRDVHGHDPSPSESVLGRGGPTLQFGLLALAVLGVGLHSWTGSLWGYWLCAALAGLIALARETYGRPLQPDPDFVRTQRLALWGLGLICAVAAAAAHHGDADDAFYVNLSVWALDHPAAPLLLGDTLHGFDGIPMSLPVFKLLSFEILQAAVARLTGVSALTVAHLWVPPLMAFLIPFAWARLARLLLPTRWLFVVGLIIAQLFLLGDGHASYGDFGLLRLQQGKTVMLLVALPLIASYGIRFGLEPTFARGSLLAAAQIATVGLSTSALWLAPTTAFLGFCASVPVRDVGVPRALRTLSFGLLSCLYPLALALFMRSETLRAFREAVHPLPSLDWSGPELMAQALDLVAGSNHVAMLLLFCPVAALALSGTALFRRYLALVCGAFFLFFFDPGLARLVAHQVTGTDTYFRVFWVLPMPLIIASVLSAPLVLGSSLGPMRKRSLQGCTVVGALALLLWLPGMYTLSSENQVRLDWPGPKIPPHAFAAARRMAEVSGEGDFVLAPPPVARWIPLMQDYPAPLSVRAMHLDRLHDRLGADELRKRQLLTQMVGGLEVGAGGPALLEDAVTRYPLSAVLLSGPALGSSELRRVLLTSELEVDFRDANYELWARKKESETPEPE